MCTTEKGFPARQAIASARSESHEGTTFSQLKPGDKFFPRMDGSKPAGEKRLHIKLDGTYQNSTGPKPKQGNAVIYSGPADKRGMVEVPAETEVFRMQ